MPAQALGLLTLSWEKNEGEPSLWKAKESSTFVFPSFSPMQLRIRRKIQELQRCTKSQRFSRLG